jgi:hypothetical protein
MELDSAFQDGQPPPGAIDAAADELAGRQRPGRLANGADRLAAGLRSDWSAKSKPADDTAVGTVLEDQPDLDAVEFGKCRVRVNIGNHVEIALLDW